MGPRVNARGNFLITAAAVIVGVLQWGRGLMPAEMYSLDPMVSLLLALQWGRGLMPAEIWNKLTHSLPEQSFNGAAG